MQRATLGHQTARRFWIVLAALAVAALLWRVGYVWTRSGRLLLNGDAFFYHSQANDLADGLWFVDPVELRHFGRVTPSAFHPPLYSSYLGVVSWLGATSETAHRVASAFLGGAAVFTLGALGRRVFRSDVAGWLAAAGAGVYAHLWINDEMLLSESIYVLAIAVAMLLTYRFWDRPSVARAAAMGAGIGVAALARAEAAALFVILVVPLVWFARSRAPRGLGPTLVAAAAAGAAVLAPWLAFNATRFERPVLMSNGLGSVLVVANCDYVSAGGEYAGTYHGPLLGYWQINCKGDLDARIAEQFDADRAVRLQADLGTIPGTDDSFFGDESTHEAAWRALAVEEMRDHARELPRAVAWRVLRAWDLVRVSQNVTFNGAIEGRGDWQSALATYQYFVFVPLALAGVVRLRQLQRPVLPFVAIAMTVTLAAALTFGITRYRAPVDALLPVLAGGAVAAVIDRARGRSEPLDARW